MCRHIYIGSKYLEDIFLIRLFQKWHSSKEMEIKLNAVLRNESLYVYKNTQYLTVYKIYLLVIANVRSATIT